MAYMRTRNAAVCAKIEGSEGVEEALNTTNDGILVANPQFKYNGRLISTDEVTGSLDGQGDLVGGGYAEISFDIYGKGSGVAGTAPEVGAFLKCCGMSETVTGTAVPSSAEALANGGSTTTAVLGSSASSTAQTYRGMPITFSSAVSGNSFIANYTGAKLATLTDTLGGALVNTSNYQILVNVLYAPASSSIPSSTVHLYVDGLLYKIIGARGNFSYGVDAGGALRFSFTFRGMFVSVTDVSVPLPAYDSTRPPLFKNGVFKIDRVAAAINSLSVDMGNSLENPANPNAAEGFDVAIITARKIRGSIDPSQVTVATRDLLSKVRAGTNVQLHARWGATAGNKIGITFPSCLLEDAAPGDRNGIAVESVPFQAVGQESGMFLCFY